MALSVDVGSPLEGRLRIDVQDAPGEVLLTLQGEVDVATTPLLEAALAQVLVGGRRARVVLDLAGLGFMDASGIGCIVRAERRLAARGEALAVRRPSRPARRLLELCDLGGFMR